MKRGLATALIALASGTGAGDLYERLGLKRSADQKAIKKAWYQLALREHPDKVTGGPQEKEVAAQRFKAAAEAYEVLSDIALRKRYDATGAVPDDKAKAEAATKSRGTGDDDEFGFDDEGGGRPNQQSRGGFGFQRFDQFEVNLAQSRARRVRTLESLRRLLQPTVSPRRFGLVGFYDAKDASLLKQGLRFPYPFAGWSLANTGDGFWWEDALQTILVSVGASSFGNAGDGSGVGSLLSHFGITSATPLPAVSWVRRDDAMSFVMVRNGEAALRTPDAFVGFVYGHLGATVRIVNHDHRPALVWWLDGHSAKRQGVVQPGDSFERSSFISHRWFCWAESTEGNLLTESASLGQVTLSQVGEVHELVLSGRCVDGNGHCSQWRQQGECERNPNFMHDACPRSCSHNNPRGCEHWSWLYESGLGELHADLSCWADAACARGASLHTLPGGRSLSGSSELRKLPKAVANGLREIARRWVGPRGATKRRTLERLLVGSPPPVPPATTKGAPPPPPPPSPRDEL